MEFVKSIDYVLMYFQLSKLYASISVCPFHSRPYYETQKNFCGCCRISLIKEKFLFDVPVPAF